MPLKKLQGTWRRLRHLAQILRSGGRQGSAIADELDRVWVQTDNGIDRFLITARRYAATQGKKGLRRIYCSRDSKRYLWLTGTFRTDLSTFFWFDKEWSAWFIAWRNT